MTEKVTGLVIACCAVCAIAVSAGSAGSQSAPGPVRVGLYDSRAVALAYGRSESFMKALRDLKGEADKAKDGKDEARVKRLDAEGRALQDLLHQQVFSTGSVNNIMKKINPELPAIGKEVGVSVIVSKWEVAYGDPSVEYIDVTSRLVRLFHPSEQTLKIIESLGKQEPVPLDKIRMETSK